MIFKKLTTNDYYHESDSLSREGEDFKAGKYFLRFPNGVIEQHNVKIEIYDGEAQVDMNCYPDFYEGRKAYITIEYNGARVKLYLRENKIEIGVNKE